MVQILMRRYEPSHDLHCLQKYLCWSTGLKGFKQLHFFFFFHGWFYFPLFEPLLLLIHKYEWTPYKWKFAQVHVFVLNRGPGIEYDTMKLPFVEAPPPTPKI